MRGGGIMLRPASTNVSIITNFGCRQNCWYCIWKNHKLRDIKLTTDWNKLEKFIESNKHLGKFSISGGGDCLYNYAKYEDWWRQIFELAFKYNMLVDVHSRERFYYPTWWRQVHRCVISSDILNDDEDYIIWLSKQTKVRVVHLVTEHTSEYAAEAYIQFAYKHNLQLTFKKLVGYEDYHIFETLHDKYKNSAAQFLDAGDYNIYYMPDNNIYKEFLTP